MRLIKFHIWLLLLIVVNLIFVSPFLFFGKVPIPHDALIGLYHPWRDALHDTYPNGYPFKNPLITDPIRQQYVYRSLAIDQLKKGILPKWNPYAFSGTPLLANIQTAVFYPFNIIFWFVSDKLVAWSILVLLQPLLASVFTYLYLRNSKIVPAAAFLGGVSFAFSGFMVAWMEWNTIGHVALWLPLILLAKDKLVKRFSFHWVGILIFAESAAFFAGHLQTWLYVVVFSSVYLFFRIWQISKKTFQVNGNHVILTSEELACAGRRARPGSVPVSDSGQARMTMFVIFITTGLLMLIITSIQWMPTVQFILQSARNFDFPDWHRPDWFLPWAHLVQLVVPDFFGNPATGNYWGVWNYGEFVSYIGILPLMMAFFAIFFRRDKKTLFFAGALISAFIFVLPTWFAQIPYVLQIPFLSTLQPSRIIFIVNFCLAILGAFGFDYLLKSQSIRSRFFNYFLVGFGMLFMALWLVLFLAGLPGKSQELIANLLITKRNLVLPTVFWFIATVEIFLIYSSSERNESRSTSSRQARTIILVLLLFFTTLDVIHFANKFLPFVSTPTETAKAIDFLEKNAGFHRVMAGDRRMLPPNTAGYFHLQSVDGYDPLYLKSYGEVVAAWTRNQPDIAPAAFNRILTPEKIDSFFTDLLGVKYILSLKDEDFPKLRLVFQEGETRVYENTRAYSRAFFVTDITHVENTQELFNQLFAHQHKLDKIAFTTENVYVKPAPINPGETVSIESYTENEVRIKTRTNQERLLVLTDIYYPEWKVFIGGFESTIFPVDHIFRGVIVPKGESTVVFKM